ncbi:hypothetical protein [Photorhabdus luminescens]|uniref:hypothetical protein n=1 Tax=Photorhabdus luminescens TaxID=29488 RepID=UPI00269152BB
MLTSLRTIEIRAAEWLEIDYDKCMMHRPHLVPLSSQEKALLLELQEITGGYCLAIMIPENQ